MVKFLSRNNTYIAYYAQNKIIYVPNKDWILHVGTDTV